MDKGDNNYEIPKCEVIIIKMEGRIMSGEEGGGSKPFEGEDG